MKLLERFDKANLSTVRINTSKNEIILKETGAPVAFILQMLEGMSLNMFITGCQIDRNKQKKAFAVENNFICSTDL